MISVKRTIFPSNCLCRIDLLGEIFLTLEVGMKILHLMNAFDCGAGGEENGRRCRRDFGTAVP